MIYKTGKFSNVIIHYVDFGTPKLAMFDNVAEGDEWIIKFLFDNQLDSDSYINSVFVHGELVYCGIDIGVDRSGVID